MVEVNDRKFTIILREEAHGYSAQVVEFPGCISEGKTRAETLANIKEALEGYIEAFPEELDQLKGKRELVQISV
jgi:predicted RNase H-like HicB family nuclease